MKQIILLLSCLYLPTVVYAEEHLSTTPYLVMGLYYPSLSNISNKTDIQVSLNYWVDELTAHSEVKGVESVMFENIHSLKTAFENREVDLVVAPPLLLSMYFNKHLLREAFIAVQFDGNLDNDNLLIIARKDDDKKQTSFKGKRLLLPKSDLFAKYFIDAEVMARYHKSSRHVFSQIQESSKNQRIILALFFNKADIGVVYESALTIMTELNPQISNRISILKKFPIKSRNYSYFHRDYPYQKQLKARASEFSSRTRGMQILEVFQASKIVPSYVADLKPFEYFYNTYLELKKTYNNAGTE